VRSIGSSTYPAAQIVKAQWVARDRGHQRFVCEQPPYSILTRGIEADVPPTCRELGMGTIVWSPLAGGWLSGRWRKGVDDLTSRRTEMMPDRYDLSIPANQAKLDAADALGQLADESGISLIHMALAFVIRHPAVTAAIIGPRTIEQLESQLGAADLALDAALAGPNRRDRDAREQRQPNRRRVDQSRAGRGRPPQIGTPRRSRPVQGVSGPSGACLQRLMLMRLVPIGDQAATPPSKVKRIRPPWRPLNLGRLPTVRTPSRVMPPRKPMLRLSTRRSCSAS
jgi:hypothetical protein